MIVEAVRWGSGSPHGPWLAGWISTQEVANEILAAGMSHAKQRKCCIIIVIRVRNRDGSKQEPS